MGKFSPCLTLFLALQVNNPVWAVKRADADLPLHLNIPNIGSLGEWKRGHKVNNGRIDFGDKGGGAMLPALVCPPGKVLAYKDQYVSCCNPGQRLLASDNPGTLESVWDCCAKGHDLTGTSKKIGYHCCLTGQVWDGKKCKQPDPVCKNGKVLHQGKCVCPPGKRDDGHGKCVCPAGKKDDGRGKCIDDVKCTSGIHAGKCYTIQSEDGSYYGMTTNAQGVATGYSTGKESAHHIFGVFQFCLDEQCRAVDINPGKGFHIKDRKGLPGTGQGVGQWLDQQFDGAHIGRTPDFKKSGVFTITKWPCGKYCVGGFNWGLGPTCPNDYTGVTFTRDKEACVIMIITEVPCDIKAAANNCIWKSGDQCCNRIDCSGKPNTAKHDAMFQAFSHLQHETYEPPHVEYNEFDQHNEFYEHVDPHQHIVHHEHIDHNECVGDECVENAEYVSHAEYVGNGGDDLEWVLSED